jgi:hypothetical protein
MAAKQSTPPSDERPLDALLAIALQLRARLDAKDGIRRNLGNEAVQLRAFGYKNPEIATIIGSTPASVAELIRLAQKTSKGNKRSSEKQHRKD